MRVVTMYGAAVIALFGAAAVPARDAATNIVGREHAAHIAPGDGGAAIELANAYWLSGHHGQAHEAYRRALALDNVMLELPGGDSIWSHQVARQMLASEVTLTAR